MQLIRTLFIALLSLACLAAQAQWQWIDNAGRKVFSDQPPPLDIPAKNILKQPAKAASVANMPVAAPVSAGAAAAPPLSADDKELLAKKKKAEAQALASAKARVRQSGQDQGLELRKGQGQSGLARLWRAHGGDECQRRARVPRRHRAQGRDATYARRLRSQLPINRAFARLRVATCAAHAGLQLQPVQYPALAPGRRRANKPAVRAPCASKRLRRATLGSTRSGR